MPELHDIDTIYVARVKTCLLKRYVVTRWEENIHLSNYNIRRRQLIGYFEGATPVSHAKNSRILLIKNGIPDEVRGGLYPKMKLTHLKASELSGMLDKAGVRRFMGSSLEVEF